MRVRAAALVCLLTVLGTLSGCGDAVPHGGDGGDGGETSGGAASCVGPYLDDQPPDGRFGQAPPTVRPGDSLELHGHWYTDTCNDTGGDDPLVPLSDVRLTVTFPDGTTTELGPLTPGGRDLGFTAIVDVPEGMALGQVVVRDDREHPASYRFDIGRSNTLVPEVVEWDGKGFAPPVTLDLDGRRVDLHASTACYGNGCFDGIPAPPYVDVGNRDSVPFSFSDPDWTFTARFRSDDGPCPRVVSVPVRRTSDRTFEVTSAGPRGSWIVDLVGAAPAGGDLYTTFAWTTREDGPLPGPATGSAGVLADHDGKLDSYGVEVYVQDLAESPQDATATVAVTSAEGRSVTLTPRLVKGGCPEAGQLSFTASDDQGRRATQLGAGPFTYDVALTMDGATYHGVGTWPDGETEDIAPHVPLTWTPALPVYRG